MTAEPLSSSRRELNKARTRHALIEAARELIRQRGLGGVTAEDIADGAGVSRRTFFNYFSSIEGVVAAGLAEPLDRLAAAMHRRPADEDPLQAMIEALREEPLGPEILLDWQLPTPSAEREMVHMRLWQHHREWLTDVLRERMADHPRLHTESLAAAVMAIFEVVHQEWVPVAGASAQQAIDSLNIRLRQALQYARRGWRELH
ncbi:MAG TPA: helix-turn-helix domain-containing protein [Actinomycetaceae bacterium]|nr:helix-turn-helix domain-containing protein [Actinomycetaceae bacterium]